jgi:hypothetical protein
MEGQKEVTAGDNDHTNRYDLDTSLSEEQCTRLENAADKETNAMFDYFMTKAVERVALSSEEKTDNLKMTGTMIMKQTNSYTDVLVKSETVPAKDTSAVGTTDSLTRKPFRDSTNFEQQPLRFSEQKPRKRRHASGTYRASKQPDDNDQADGMCSPSKICRLF